MWYSVGFTFLRSQSLSQRSLEMKLQANPESRSVETNTLGRRSKLYNRGKRTNMRRGIGYDTQQWSWRTNGTCLNHMSLLAVVEAQTLGQSASSFTGGESRVVNLPMLGWKFWRIGEFWLVERCDEIVSLLAFHTALHMLCYPKCELNKTLEPHSAVERSRMQPWSWIQSLPVGAEQGTLAPAAESNEFVKPQSKLLNGALSLLEVI